MAKDLKTKEAEIKEMVIKLCEKVKEEIEKEAKEGKGGGKGGGGDWGYSGLVAQNC